MNDKKIIFYGAMWCPDCYRSKNFFDTHNIEYDYIDLEVDIDAVEIVTKITGGYQSIPTIVFPDGSILIEPSNEELARKLNIEI